MNKKKNFTHRFTWEIPLPFAQLSGRESRYETNKPTPTQAQHESHSARSLLFYIGIISSVYLTRQSSRQSIKTRFNQAPPAPYLIVDLTALQRKSCKHSTHICHWTLLDTGYLIHFRFACKQNSNQSRHSTTKQKPDFCKQNKQLTAVSRQCCLLLPLLKCCYVMNKLSTCNENGNTSRYEFVLLLSNVVSCCRCCWRWCDALVRFFCCINVACCCCCFFITMQSHKYWIARVCVSSVLLLGGIVISVGPKSARQSVSHQSGKPHQPVCWALALTLPRTLTYQSVCSRAHFPIVDGWAHQPASQPASRLASQFVTPTGHRQLLGDGGCY